MLSSEGAPDLFDETPLFNSVLLLGDNKDLAKHSVGVCVTHYPKANDTRSYSEVKLGRDSVRTEPYFFSFLSVPTLLYAPFLSQN